ncbi:MAG TPA: hypothetical protein DHI91_02075 [Candidatus Portnoybacteria bacterium]|uniref:Mur ligase central domain-containing protein n=1 Tax=Candidatus Portnoybacteria bacterium CG02_land_8_20_14_3_00_45_8 TaxID=1974807 RepID=A0A2M7D6B4_9BACT|nr:MAG: hypothetical protein COS30_01585 [Candidatus Portnoybacteria bacterium CG02_land_8_20_14_3_00_45_8]HCX27906.1 hypothetical protein [Candidatus Portnoybacteria bacterium]
MKVICRFILQYYLKYLTKLVLVVRRPLVVAVAGSANKAFFKEKIKESLRLTGLAVRSNPKNFNTLVGLPLAILDLPSGYHSYRGWLPIIFRSPLALWQRGFPKVLVLEFGVSDPGEMKKLLAIVKPKMAVITGITQRYLEAFSDVDELVGEYEYLVKKVAKKGLVVLNYDNARLRVVAKQARARVKFFSLQSDCPEEFDVKNFWRAKELGRGEIGEIVQVVHDMLDWQQELDRFGQHHIYALLAGLIVKEEILKQENV